MVDGAFAARFPQKFAMGREEGGGMMWCFFRVREEMTRVLGKQK